MSHAERRKIITAEKYLLSRADNKRHNRPQGLFAGMSVLRAILLTAHVASGLSSGSRAAPAPAARPALGGGGSGGDGGVSSDDEALVQSLTAQALGERGTPEGLSALETLDWLSSRRLPYDFGVSEDGGGAGPGPGRFPRRGVVSRLRRVLPGDVAAGASDLVDDMERRGWLSTNPDSVDGLPSLHLNLVSGGEKVFDTASESPDRGGSDATFKGRTRQIYDLVRPYLEEDLLPRVRQIVGSPTVELSDVFLRRYGEGVQPDGKGGAATRQGISAHFDVTASTTSVVALDSVASEGKSGLYTVQSGDASNHAALRRYFPLDEGDAVVHTWDVLHGVQIDPGQRRTSLICWFEDHEGGTVEGDSTPGGNCPPSWLLNPGADDDVGAFVLGIAHESLAGDAASGTAADLYARAAARGNQFALTRLASLCDEGGLTAEQLAVSAKVAEKLGSSVGESPDTDLLARELWRHGAMRGNPLAQITLGDECMHLSMECYQRNDLERSSDLRLTAATLFGLAAQQGDGDASAALSRVLEMEASFHETQEEFLNSPVLLTVKASMVSNQIT